MSLVLIISTGWAVAALAFGVLARAIGSVAPHADAVSAATVHEPPHLGRGASGDPRASRL